MPNAPDAPNRPAAYRLAEAVIAVAKRPSRAAYATWVQVIEPGWLLPMLALTVGIHIFNGIISMVVRTFLIAPTTSARYLFGAPSPLDFLFYAIFITPLFYLMSFALLMFLVARLMPAELGTVQQRAIHLARPYLLEELVSGFIALLISQPISILQKTSLVQNPLVGTVVEMMYLAVALYFFIATLNALAAGSGRSRWLLFAIWLLSAVFVMAFVWYGLGALLSLVGIHLPIPALR